MKRKLLIIGASGHGRVVADIALKLKKWKDVAFLDDDESIESVMNLRVIGNSNDAATYVNDYDFFVAIGNNATRKKVYEMLEKLGASIPTLIHPNAVIGNQVDIGTGTVVMAGAVINSCTSIGRGCIINTSSTVDHDNNISDFVHISPGVNIAGTVNVGQGAWLGIGCAISNNISITKDCIVGAGSVVIRDLSESGTYIGVPARRV